MTRNRPVTAAPSSVVLRAGQRTSRGTLFVVLLGVCWLSAGPLPVVNAWRELAAPSDFTPDYVTAVAWVRQGKAGQPLPAVLDRRTANDYAVSVGARRIVLLGPYYVHPPTALLVMLPLTLVSYRAAVVAWQIVSVALVALLAWVLAPVAAAAGAPIRAPILFVLLLLWPPVLTNLELGQWSIALAAVLALGHRAWERGRAQASASWMGVATALKLTPVILLPFLFLHDRRAALRFVGVFGGLCLLALPLGGLPTWITLLRESGPNTFAWQTFWHNTLSLNGLWARLFVGGQFARPLLAMPTLARALRLASALTLLGIAALATRGARAAAPERDRGGCVLALWYVLMVVLNPLGWSHYGVLLLLPAALAARAAQASADRSARALVAVGLALLSIPKETLLPLALPLPTSPLGGLVLSTHLGGALLVFGAAARGAFPRGETLA